MAIEPPDMTLKAIGFVRNEVKQSPGAGYGWGKVVSDIVVDGSLSEALDGLEDFSHIIVFFWMHRLDATGQPLVKIHPMKRPDLPLVGLFATRSPYRPNPLGETTVRLLEHRGNILKVQGLDAIDGTPVVDLKPYLPEGDAPANARVAPWVDKQ